HPSPGVLPWRPAGLKHLPFGDALFTVLAGLSIDHLLDLEETVEAEREAGMQFGWLQPLFQPYFPEWRNSLVLPEVPAREGVFVFRVSLGKVWRQIAIPADLTLESLANAILDSVNFDDDHLYEFIYRDRFGTTARVQHPYCDEGPFTSEV